MTTSDRRLDQWAERRRKAGYWCVRCAKAGSILEAGTWYCSPECQTAITDARRVIAELNTERRRLRHGR